ncbi:MAG: hypothetical protein IT385_12610 [Deltaproteobacteria bacterium]|nr:hypothetical protein [Deltaproteobacteria bacterium]
MTAPPAHRHWVVSDPRPIGALAATQRWTDLLDELVDASELLELAYGIEVAGRERTLRPLVDAIDELARHAQHVVEAHEASRSLPLDERPVTIDEQTFLVAIHRFGLTLDAAIALLGGRLRVTSLKPSDKLYPAELLRELVRAPDRGDRFRTEIARQVEADRPDAWRAVTAALAPIAGALESAQRWPDPAHARAAVPALRAIEPSWEKHALLVRERARRTGKPSSEARHMLSRALDWAVATRHMLERLASTTGWVRLMLDYYRELRAGVARLIAEARRDTPTSTFLDVVDHELAHVVQVVDADPLTAEASFVARDAGDPNCRKRLSRGRGRCLARWTQVEPDPDWDERHFDELLAAIARMYDAAARRGSGA